MSSMKNWMVGVVAGVAACSSFALCAEGVATVSADGKSQDIATDVPGIAGITYLPVGSAGQLSVATTGYLFCDNVGSADSMRLPISHVEAAPSGAALATPYMKWTQQEASVRNFSYSGGKLVVNPGVSVSSLTCLNLTAAGSTTTAVREGIFDTGHDPHRTEQFPHLINWVPPAGTPDWQDAGWAPDGTNWSDVPADACGWDAYESAHVKETLGCAAITGVRPEAGTTGRRAPTMWTNMQFLGGTAYYTYVFRVDARYGAPEPGPTTMALPSPSPSSSDAEPNALAMQVLVRDSYNASFLSKAGSYCFFTQFPDNPSTSGDFCASVGAGSQPLPSQPSDNGLVSLQQTLGPAPVFQPTWSFYIAVTRSLIVNTPSGFNSPLAAASIFVDPTITPEGYDAYIGDDAAFAFSSLEKGFPWMVVY